MPVLFPIAAAGNTHVGMANAWSHPKQPSVRYSA